MAEVFTNFEDYAKVINQMALSARESSDETSFYGKDSTGEGYSFAFNELTYVDPTIYERRYRPVQYEEFIFQNFINAPYITDYAYLASDFAGRAHIQSGAEGPAPTVELAYNKFEEKVYLAKIAFEITQEELRQTAFIGRATQNQRMDACIEAVDRTLNVYSLFGNSEYGVTGFYNKPLVPTTTSIVQGGWLKTGVTADQIVDDFIAALNIFFTQTNNTAWPTDVYLPFAQANLIAEMPRFVENTLYTVLEWIREKNGISAFMGQTLRFHIAYGLEKAGSGGVPRMILWNRQPRVMEQFQPMPLRFLAPQFHGTAIQNFGEFKFSPPICRYPGEVLYVDGI